MIKQNMKNSILIILFVLLIGCSSTNKKLETHPTGELNVLESFCDIICSGNLK